MYFNQEETTFQCVILKECSGTTLQMSISYLQRKTSSDGSTILSRIWKKIVQETNDEHLHVIIYDFDSKDIDIKEAFQRTTPKNYHYITKPGNYSRARSFKEAIESVKNPDSIVVTIDMHPDIGSQFMNEIRKVSYIYIYIYIYIYVCFTSKLITLLG